MSTEHRSLKRLFGFEEFRPGQRAAVDLIATGDDALIVMPTGAGKSLCYQLPALTRPGMTLVISPLVALMKDQVDGLRSRGLPATVINSMIAKEERQRRQRAIAAGEFKLVYAAPERLRSPTFLRAVRAANLNLIVVDEAHCVSQWGHDFRPDYLRVGAVAQQLGRPQMVGLTATATRDVQKDIIRQLALTEPHVMVSGFERPNLFFEVVPTATRADKLGQLNRLLRAHPGGASVVYCATRKQVETVCRELREAGHRAGMYHGGLSVPARDTAQDTWMRGKVSVLVATNAFGMGVDRGDVRLVAHWNVPGSLEAYYQEAGRAGRDGAQATCAMLYSREDRDIRDFFIDNTFPARRRVERVWNWLREQPETTVRCNVDSLAASIGPSGDRLHSMGMSAALRMLQREGHIRQMRGGRRNTQIELGDRDPTDQLRIEWDDFDRRHAAMQRQLNEMLGFVEEKSCLQAHIIRHFNATPVFGERCGNCVNCVPVRPYERRSAGSGELSETTVRGIRIMLSAVARMNESANPRTVAAVLTGSRARRVTGPGYDELSVYGLFKGEHSQRRIVAALAVLERARLLSRTSFGLLAITATGRSVMTGNAPIWPAFATDVEKALGLERRSRPLRRWG